MPDRYDDGEMMRATPQFAFPRLTPVVKKLLIAYAIVFLVSFGLWEARDTWFGVALEWLGLDGARWQTSFPLVPAWQLLTYGFLHSVEDPWHVIGNALTLYFFGTMLEEMLGARRFLITYFGAQLVGALCWLIPAAFGTPMGLAIGASGAVYGVMIAVATLRPRQIVYFIFIPVMLKWLAILICAATVFSALVQLKTGAGGVAYLVHVGGALYGFLAVKAGLIQKDPIEMLERRRAVAEVQRAADDDARMDTLLAKIHREGMSSLTRSERDFLKRASSRR